jgi:hypothetical protein
MSRMAKEPDVVKSALAETRLFSHLASDVLDGLAPLFVERTLRRKRYFFIRVTRVSLCSYW